jgi:nucleoside-diphosphate-sugar epimerase
LVICGTGDVSRNFLYVTDHAKANVLALSDAAKNEVFNIEGSETITVSQVANKAKELANKNVEIQYTPARTGEFNGKNVSTEKAKKILNWQPTISFSQGIKMHYDWLSKKKCYV